MCDLYGRVHRAVEIIHTGALPEARLVCTEQEPKSDYSRLYPWHRVVPSKGEVGEKCSVCFPSRR